jgi:hypothetical protein
MTTKRIATALFVGSLIAACSSADGPGGEPDGPAPEGAQGGVTESTGSAFVVGDVVNASLAASGPSTRTVHFGGASTLRLHFTKLALGPNARLVIESSGGGKAQLTAADNGPHVWAPTLDGDRLTVRLVNDGGGGGGSYAVNKVARGFPEGAHSFGPPADRRAVSTVCGADNRRRAACYDEPRFGGAFEATGAVARVLLVRNTAAGAEPLGARAFSFQTTTFF